MSASGDQYQYEVLQSQTSFRLLRVFADPYDAPLRGQLKETSIEQKPSYSALSYVWGDSVHMHNLHVDGCILSIRQNLFDGIRRLRMQGTTDIWIDAICINQKDTDERAAQVMLMRQIYELADIVLVYLGESKESTQLGALFDSLLQFCVFRSMGTKNEDRRINSIDWSDLTKYGLPDVLDAQWQYLVRLLEHPWFSRVWVFQESLVSRKCRFLYGDLLLDQQNFFAILYVMQQHDFAGHIDREKRPTLSPVTTSICRCMAIFLRQGPIGAPFTNQTWVRSPLIQLLRDNATAKATDPRDHIFALLGVSNEAEEVALRPNYLESVDEIYMRVAKYMVKSGHGPLLLNSAGSTRSIQGSGLLSWVPRWGEKGPSQLPYRFRDMCVSEVFKAAGHTAQAFRIQEKQSSLIVRGIVLDTIKHLGTSRYVAGPVNYAEQIDEFEMTTACLAEILIMLGNDNSYPGGEPILEVVSRLSVCDRVRAD